MWPRIGDADGLLVNGIMLRRGAAAGARRGAVDADLFGAAGRALLALGDAGEQLVLDIVGELEPDGVVEVVVAIANVARVGPGRLGVGGRTAWVGGSRAMVGGLWEGRGLRMPGRVGVLARLDGAQRNVGRETAALVWMNFGGSGPVLQRRPPAV